MSQFWNGVKVFGIALSVQLLGGLIESISNFHPTDQIGAIIMTTIGAVVIAGLNALKHKLQGTTVAKVEDVVKTP